MGTETNNKMFIDGLVVGYILGIFITLIAFGGLVCKFWLSPKVIEGEVYYYGLDYTTPKDTQNYWWIRGNKYIMVNNKLIKVE